MVRAITILVLAAIACPSAIVLADEDTPPPDRIVVTPPDSDDPRFGEYVYVEELPEALEKAPPVYPEAARRQGLEGTVLVQALVGRDGRVKDTRVVKSIPLLDSAAVAAVRQWKFKPAMSKNKPVAVWVAVPVRFTLHGQSAPSEKPLDTDAFNARLAAAGDSAWAQAPATIAIELVGGAECDCACFSVEAIGQPERFDQAEVFVVRDGTMDDSIRGDRHRMTMRREAGIWRLTSASISWRCQKSRGHEDYSAEPCL